MASSNVAKRTGYQVGISPELGEDAECLQEDANRQDLIEKVNTQLNILHQIFYGNFDPCELYHSNTAQDHL